MGDADMTLDKVLERALHIEAVTRIEEEHNEPRVYPSSRTETLN